MLCCVGRRFIEVYSTRKLWNGATNVEMKILTSGTAAGKVVEECAV